MSIHRKAHHKDLRSQAWLNAHVRSVVFAIVLLISLTAIGVFGFMIIEGWSFHDSFFMTVITLSTVGYGEVHPLSQVGETFAAILIMNGMLVAAYSFSVIGSSALEGQLHRFRRVYKMNKQISAMKKHFIICGYNSLSSCMIPDLLERGKDVVVIESNHDMIEELNADKIAYVEGHAYEDEVLLKAGVKNAEALVAVSPHDADNVFISLSARSLNKNLRIIARTEDLAAEKKIRLAGANSIIAPLRVGGARIVQQLINPFVNDFLEIATDSSGTQLALEQFIIPEGCELSNLTIEQSNIRAKTGVLIAARIKPDGNMVLSPSKDDQLETGSTLIVLGTRESLETLSKSLTV